ncbi:MULTISPECIES: molecular chaperone [Vibrio]|uniref:Molecular chaperone n=1 Tax=bacterium 19MO03SA05 TaxID=2920620 RepID=A0AAU6VHW6_UNCXX|nr:MULTISPECIES: molecular chaperone [Vibrio]EKO3570674.1 molecular chaperone [Vibrio metschnikovii]EKO3580614.1 molecular chaperone [Vibrio metschnikovii]EKO3654266.1 molecular chaperone [Vibrio metschnikovii]
MNILFYKHNILFLLSLCCLFFSNITYAVVIPETSRVVYNLDKNEQSLYIYNKNKYPVLVQLWSDNGDVSSSPEVESDSPIIPLPAIFRLAEDESKNIRLIKVDDNVAKDRETLYWLNIYEVPPLPDVSMNDEDSSVLMVTVRTQIKVILRPENLFKMIEDIPKKVTFEIDNGHLILINNSPFYITISSLTLTERDKDSLYDGMIEPFSKIPVDWNSGNKIESLFINYINDQGSEVSMTIKNKN